MHHRIVFCPTQNITTIRRLSPFQFRSLHPFTLPFFHHTNSTRRRRYVLNCKKYASSSFVSLNIPLHFHNLSYEFIRPYLLLYLQCERAWLSSSTCALKLVFVVVSPYFFSLISFPCLGLPFLFLSTALLYISSLSPSSNTIGTLLIVSVAAAGRIISRDSCVWCRLQLWSIREPPCCWHVSCLSVSYLFWLSLAILCSSFPRRYFAPQSHLHIGLPFGTPISCLQLEQVMIPLGSFSPTL